MMKSKLGLSISAILVIGAVTILLQLWTDAFSYEFFMKFMVSLAVLLVVIGLLYVVKREFQEEEKLKKDGYIDS